MPLNHSTSRIPSPFKLKLWAIRLISFLFSRVERNINGEFAKPVVHPLIWSSQIASFGFVPSAWISIPRFPISVHTRRRFSPSNMRTCSSVAPRSINKATRSEYCETSYADQCSGTMLMIGCNTDFKSNRSCCGTAELLTNAHVVPSSNVGNVDDMSNDIMNCGLLGILHSQESVDKHSRDDPTVLLESSQNIIWGMPKILLDGICSRVRENNWHLCYWEYISHCFGAIHEINRSSCRAC